MSNGINPKLTDSNWKPPDPFDPTTATARALRLIERERERQIKVERFNDVHDDRYTHGELARAAASYTLEHVDAGRGAWNTYWPWAMKWWKPGDPLRNLAKAGALILAEMERIERVLEEQQHS